MGLSITKMMDVAWGINTSLFGYSSYSSIYATKKRYFLGKKAYYTSSTQVPLFTCAFITFFKCMKYFLKTRFYVRKGEMCNFFGTSQNLLLALCGCQGNHSLRLYCKGFQKVELCKRSGGGEQILLYKSLSINNEIGEEPTEMSNT